MWLSRFAILKSTTAVALLCLSPATVSVAVAAEAPPAAVFETVKPDLQDEHFTIRRFIISNIGRFSFEELQQQVLGFTGRNKNYADIETARNSLESFFHNQGYSDAKVRLVEYSRVTRNVLFDVELRAGNAGTRESGKTVEAAKTPEVASVKPEDSDLLPEEPEEKAVIKDDGFTIKSFIIEGTKVFTQEEMQQQVKPFTGRKKSAADIEAARDALENFFRSKGYPAMVVNIPAQSSTNKVFRLKIVENRVGKIFLSGNNWYSSSKIMRELPSIAPGSVLRLTDLQKEVNDANRNPDFKVMPEMLPGKAPETVDIALKVQDKLPLHGSLELSNRANHDTTPLRLSASMRYDNLWQRDHSLSVQYMMTPQAPDEVEVFSSSYTLPVFWNKNDKLTVYGVVSSSNVNSALGYSNLGKGNIIGSRLIMPLKSHGSFSHTSIFGFDYKEFADTVGLIGTTGTKTPIRYAPVMTAYNAYLFDESGLTSFNLGFSYIFRGLLSDPHEFQDKRYKSRGNAINMNMGVERNQRLPAGLGLLVKVDGQISDQPLISNEQYFAGGMDSVRGYSESEVTGDNAVHGVIELSIQQLFKKSSNGKFIVSPYIFYDYAQLWTRDPLPGQNMYATLQGTGIGMKGSLLKDFEFQTDLAFPLRDTSRVNTGDPYVHFRVRYLF